MCGLLVISDLSTEVDRTRFARALACLDHRGPDGEGRLFLKDGRLALGHKRLSIFGPGEAGAQPMRDQHNNALIFNGSLYNYRELRAELAAVGFSFRTDTDTEVILAAWQQWGKGCFPRFNGTWALALYDAAQDRLIISRDRLGVRPLYLRYDGQQLILASEVRAVVAASGVPVRVNAAQAFHFLALGLTDHQDETLIDGITQVPAGALWEVNRHGLLSRRHYHQWPTPGSGPALPEAVAQLPALFEDATRLRLHADVTVAAQLSGGMDSGTVAWAIGRQQSALPADFAGFFSYGYRHGAEDFDETAAARQTRDAVAPGVAFTEVRVDPTPSLADLEDFLWAQEIPVSTPSPLAGLRLCRAMRQAGATVVLTGDGSDELFAGYTRRYLPIAWRDAVLARRWDEAARLWRSPHLDRRAAVARAAWSLPFPVLARLMHQRSHMAALNRDYAHSQHDTLRDLAIRQQLPLAEMARRDACGGLLGQILRFSDRNSMAAGMEARSPFLDYRLAEMAMGLAIGDKVNHNGGKQPLRQAMAPFLPPSVTQGPKNRGLGHAEQFRIGHLDLGGLLQDPPQASREFIDSPRLAAALRSHPGDSRLWWPVCFLLWLRMVEQRWP